MYNANKSEILNCIVPPDLENKRPMATVSVLDGAVLVQKAHDRENYHYNIVTDVRAKIIEFYFLKLIQSQKKNIHPLQWKIS